MPDPAFIRIRIAKKDLPGPVTVCGEKDLWEVLEFRHQISAVESTGFVPGGKWDARHDIMKVVLDVGSFLPSLYAVDHGNFEYIDKVELFWLQYSEKAKRQQFYFKHTMYPVKVTRIQFFMPSAKDPKKQWLNHHVSIELRYRWVEHLYTEGFLQSKAEWKLFYAEETTVQIPVQYLSAPSLSDEAGSWVAAQKKKAEQEQKAASTEKVEAQFAVLGESVFHHGSAMPVLDEKNRLVGTILSIYHYWISNRESKIALFGHTTSSGENEFNFALSEDRANLVKALLTRDREIWTKLSDKRGRVIDLQRMLKSLTANFEWSCDPGKIDGVSGPKTNAALKSFQAEFNDRFGQSISVDGIAGSQTWGAFFDVISRIIKDAALDILGSEDLPELAFAEPAVYPCGEAFTSGEGGIRSDGIRRVAVWFQNKHHHPLSPHQDPQSRVTKAQCPYYDPDKTIWKEIEAVDVGSVLMFYCVDMDGNPLSSEQFRVYDGTKELHSGNTGEKGRIEVTLETSVLKSVAIVSDSVDDKVSQEEENEKVQVGA